MSNLPVQTPAGRSAEIDLPLSALAAGEYLIELNAKTESGTAQELIAFRVGDKGSAGFHGVPRFPRFSSTGFAQGSAVQGSERTRREPEP